MNPQTGFFRKWMHPANFGQPTRREKPANQGSRPNDLYLMQQLAASRAIMPAFDPHLLTPKKAFDVRLRAPESR